MSAEETKARLTGIFSRFIPFVMDNIIVNFPEVHKDLAEKLQMPGAEDFMFNMLCGTIAQLRVQKGEEVFQPVIDCSRQWVTEYEAAGLPDTQEFEWSEKLSGLLRDAVVGMVPLLDVVFPGLEWKPTQLAAKDQMRIVRTLTVFVTAISITKTVVEAKPPTESSPTDS